LGYFFGLFLKERDDLFSYQNRNENRKIMIMFCAAISLPVLIILWACPKLLFLVIGAFGIGRGVQYYIQKKEGRPYSSVPTFESGLVFAAIPIS
jgi:1,4-dihydroxy-2-naphthoate octaprenyltransferase